MNTNVKINKIIVKFNFNGTVNVNGVVDPVKEDFDKQVEEIKKKPVNLPTSTSYYRKHDYHPNLPCSTPTCNEETQKKDRELRSQISSLQQGMKATNEINKSLEKGLNDTSARVLEQKEVIERQRKTIESLEAENKRERDKKDKRVSDLKAAIELARSYRDMAAELEKKFEKLESAMDKLFG